jgi:hypothetical protein
MTLLATADPLRKAILRVYGRSKEKEPRTADDGRGLANRDTIHERQVRMAESSSARLKAEEVAESVRARRIELVDDSGRVRASLGTPDDTEYRTGVVSLELYDRQGRARATIKVDDEGGSFGLNDTTEDNVALLYVRDPDEETNDAGNISLHLGTIGQGGPEIELSVAPDEDAMIGTFSDGTGRGDLEERLHRVEHTIRMLGMSLGLAHSFTNQERDEQRELAEADA